VSGVIAVLDSGPASIKLSLYDERGTTLRARGPIDAIHTPPRFVAMDAAGQTVAERRASRPP
jgi:hypothetical protein